MFIGGGIALNLSQRVDALLERMEVYGTEDPHRIRVEVFLKAMPEQPTYLVERSRGKTSVCTRQYT